VGDAVSVRLTVEDDGDTGDAPVVRGYGLEGMRERTKLLGGTLHAAPGEAGGWLVEAVVPKASSDA
jgi:signal transduction histidine kinase